MSLLCFFAHHRCASSWTNDILRTICHIAGWRHQVVHDLGTAGRHPASDGWEQQVDLLTCSNAKREYLSGLPPFKGLHLVRDPRDVLVSSYFSHRNSHPTDQWPELIAHRAELRSVPEQEGLLLELNCRADQFQDMLSWRYDSPEILEKKMETLIADPVGEMIEVFGFWGRLDPADGHGGFRARMFYNRAAAWTERRAGRLCPVPRWKRERINRSLLQQAVTANDFRKKSGGRIRGEQDVAHHYRAGIPGDWKNHFFPELTRRFKAEYGDVLIKLGYEKNADW
jgi:hypothetical protein